MRGPKPSEYVSTRIPRSRASTKWPASCAAMSNPRPTTVNRMGSTRGSVLDASVPCRTYVLQRTETARGTTMRELNWAVPACALALACASSPKPVHKVDDSGLARLDESQMQPVDDARVEQGRAQDALARARANEADAQARLEVAKADRNAAAAHVETANAMVEQAKFRAMKAADVPQAGSANVGVIDSRVAESQIREAQLRKQAADLRASAVDAYNKWQQTDARVRTLARPEPMRVPPPSGPEATR